MVRKYLSLMCAVIVMTLTVMPMAAYGGTYYVWQTIPVSGTYQDEWPADDYIMEADWRNNYSESKVISGHLYIYTYNAVASTMTGGLYYDHFSGGYPDNRYYLNINGGLRYNHNDDYGGSLDHFRTTLNQLVCRIRYRVDERKIY